jgi:hypothetical protein
VNPTAFKPRQKRTRVSTPADYNTPVNLARPVADFQIEVTSAGGAYLIARGDDGSLWQFNWVQAVWFRVPALPGTGDAYDTLQKAAT